MSRAKFNREGINISTYKKVWRVGKRPRSLLLVDVERSYRTGLRILLHRHGGYAALPAWSDGENDIYAHGTIPE